MDVQNRVLKREDKIIVMNDSHKRKEVIMRIYQIDTTKEGVHYSGQKQKDIIEEDGIEERLMDSLRNSFENSNQHIDVLTEEKETMHQTEVFPTENKAQQLCVFNFNKCFMNAGFVANARRDLAQVNSQIKVKEENSMEELNPWNREVNLLEKVLNSHDSIMKEGKGDGEVARKPKVGASKARVSIGVSIENNNSNLK